MRLRTYDYAQAGAYFITICTHERQHLFGSVLEDTMRLSEYGDIAASAWVESVSMRTEMALDAFVVMPNHVHGIVVIVVGRTSVTRADEGMERAGRTSVRPYATGKRTLGRFIAAYKAAVTTAINTQRGTPGAPIWQRNYYEHIIRNEEDMNRIREYIANNPARWSTDPENLSRFVQPPVDP